MYYKQAESNWKRCITAIRQSLLVLTQKPFGEALSLFLSLFESQTWGWRRGDVPAVNAELCACVCVSRARSMTEQQEQGEVTGLLSTHDQDPSKDDDAHGHFRQMSRSSLQLSLL